MDVVQFLESKIDQIAEFRATVEAQLGTDNLVLFAYPGTDMLSITPTKDLKRSFIKEAQRGAPGSWKRPFASCNPNWDAPPGQKALWVVLVLGNGRMCFTRISCPPVSCFPVALTPCGSGPIGLA